MKLWKKIFPGNSVSFKETQEKEKCCSCRKEKSVNSLDVFCWNEDKSKWCLGSYSHFHVLRFSRCKKQRYKKMKLGKNEAMGKQFLAACSYLFFFVKKNMHREIAVKLNVTVVIMASTNILKDLNQFLCSLLLKLLWIWLFSWKR